MKWLQDVGIPGAAERIGAYPHEFSGGMRQRVVIALALCAEPRLVIADEPTTALDVSIQAQVITLLRRLAREHGTSVLLVTHDMGVIAETCDRVAVMYAGRVVEVGSVGDVVHRAAHPYTAGLMGSIPDLHTRVDRLRQIDGCDAAAERDPARLPVQPALPAGVRPLPGGAARPDARARQPGRMLAVCLSRCSRRRTSPAPSTCPSRGCSASCPASGRRTLRAVDDVSFAIPKATTLSLVGESGCGKSTVARLAVGLYPPTVPGKSGSRASRSRPPGRSRRCGGG